MFSNKSYNYIQDQDQDSQDQDSQDQDSQDQDSQDQDSQDQDSSELISNLEEYLNLNLSEHKIKNSILERAVCIFTSPNIDIIKDAIKSRDGITGKYYNNYEQIRNLKYDLELKNSFDQIKTSISADVDAYAYAYVYINEFRDLLIRKFHNLAQEGVVISVWNQDDNSSKLDLIRSFPSTLIALNDCRKQLAKGDAIWRDLNFIDVIEIDASIFEAIASVNSDSLMSIKKATELFSKIDPKAEGYNDIADKYLKCVSFSPNYEEYVKNLFFDKKSIAGFFKIQQANSGEVVSFWGEKDTDIISPTSVAGV